MEIPEKAVLLTPLKTQWPFLAILWPNLATYGFIFLLDPDTSPQVLRTLFFVLGILLVGVGVVVIRFSIP